jgi:hypothetical protein
LPTYNSDEIQKVFREETTFKNGTIKGKFTYINFDQRYRLVHYTRLPYGPVKIDRVEELGKPKQDGSNASTTAPVSSDIPNAVLQLRNLLPNSLFGFPFLGPNTGQRAQLPLLNPRENNGPTNRQDDSSMYFYSTDSLATPNLYNSRVPVSLLPGQRVKPNQPVVSTQHSPQGVHAQQQGAFGMPNLQNDYSPQLNKLEDLAPPKAFRSDYEMPPISHQFQYSNLPTQISATPNSDKGIVFSYYTTNSYPVQYQYSPSVYQPYPLRIHHPPVMTPSMEPLLSHQAHQPHSHEHYMAPFMFAHSAEQQQQQQQQQQSHQSQLMAPNQNDGSRLRLKVKTSKALNVHQVGPNHGTKSAQLRLQPSEGHYSQLDSPAKLHTRSQHRQQQRLGKQNHQLLKSGSSTNQSPVVYHVLRNPYNHHQYDQGYAVAYDQQ